jgi:hypothetical protein
LAKMPTLITQTQTGYEEESSDDELSTTGVVAIVDSARRLSNADDKSVGVKVHSTDPIRRFVQISLEGKRIPLPTAAKVKVRCHLREKKNGSKATVSKARAQVRLPKPKASKAAKKGNGEDGAVVNDPNYSGTLKLLKQIQFDDLMAWRNIAFKK